MDIKEQVARRPPFVFRRLSSVGGFSVHFPGHFRPRRWRWNLPLRLWRSMMLGLKLSFWLSSFAILLGGTVFKRQHTLVFVTHPLWRPVSYGLAPLRWECDEISMGNYNKFSKCGLFHFISSICRYVVSFLEWKSLKNAVDFRFFGSLEVSGAWLVNESTVNDI
jgi:hypothetical protein